MGSRQLDSLDSVTPLRRVLGALAGLVALAALAATSLPSYLLFHTIAELLTISVAGSIFLIVWNTRYLDTNGYLSFLAVSYLFIAAIDLFHTLVYSGLGILPQFGTDTPTQLWIAARALQSVSLVLAPLFLSRKLRFGRAIFAFALVSSLLIVSIAIWNVFPVCYIDGVGLTAFKKAAEYVISFIFAIGLFLLWQKRERFDRVVLGWLSLSVLLALAAELSFSFYVSVDGLSNLAGHMLKVASFFALYKAIVETGLRRPYRLLFKEIRESEQSLEEERDFAEGLIDTAQAIISVIDTQGKIVRFNRYMEELSGYRLEEVQGHDWVSAFLPQREHARIRKLLSKALTGTPTRGNINSIVTKSGEERKIEWSDKVLRDRGGNIIGLTSIGTDVTERLRAEELLLHAATHDSLTGLANRAVFDDALRVELARAQRNNSSFALLYVDLDNFKSVNDSYGHAAGDEVLNVIATRLLEMTRANDTIARLGGDEFAILCPDVGSDSDAITTAERIMSAAETKIPAAGTEIQIAFSIGISLFPRNGETAGELLRRADTAMYCAKGAGRNTFRLAD